MSKTNLRVSSITRYASRMTPMYCYFNLFLGDLTEVVVTHQGRPLADDDVLSLLGPNTTINIAGKNMLF